MTNIQHLYSALGKQGLTRRKLAHILPEWWSPEIEATESGAQQAKLYLARALSLRIRPFSESPPRVEFDIPAEKRFKRSAKTTDSDIEVAIALARSASRIALSATAAPFTAPPPSASVIRQHILDQGHPWVGLTQLLDYCWSLGVPVLHLATKLLGKKMDGIAMSNRGRPSIVLSNKRAHGFLLFHLAHELGHIALGHVNENSAIVDDDLSQSNAAAERDPLEQAADQFAIELLTGNANSRLVLRQWVKGPELARMAVQYGRDHQIDPTHVALNCAHSENSIFALCVSAVNEIANGPTDQQVITQRVNQYLSEDLNSDDEHLLRNLIA